MKKPTGTNEKDRHKFTADLSAAIGGCRLITSLQQISRRFFPAFRPSRRAALICPLTTIAATVVLALTTGCSSVTLFQSNFNSDAVGAAPPHAQATGTIDVGGAPGSVLVVNPPPGASGHWAKISRTGDEAPITTMLCNFAAVKGPGTYTLAAAMFIPGGSGLATIEFDTSPSGAPPNTGFLHLDFMQDGTVRMDDNPAEVWGTYRHNQSFDVFVTLDITATTAVAHMSLIGSGTSGTKDYTVPLGKFANQLGAVKFWMGFPWQGSFDVTDIIVTKRKS